MDDFPEKGRLTLELAASNEKTGGSVHCWAEGGDDAGDYEVLPHLEEALNKAAEARKRELEEATKRIQAKRAESNFLAPIYD